MKWSVRTSLCLSHAWRIPNLFSVVPGTVSGNYRPEVRLDPKDREHAEFLEMANELIKNKSQSKHEID
jgi:hypothetical protein